MNRNKHFLFYIICLLTILLFSSCQLIHPNSGYKSIYTPIDQFECVPKNTAREIAQVIKIIDGDSILVKMNGKNVEVRYIGINAPEFDSPEQDADRAATENNRELVANKEIIMIRDIRDIDKYGRLLRFVFTEDYFVNYELVRRRVAVTTDYPPDLSCQALFHQASQQ